LTSKQPLDSIKIAILHPVQVNLRDSFVALSTGKKYKTDRIGKRLKG